MQYVRSLDHRPAPHLGHPAGPDTTVVAQLESVTALARSYPPGGGDGAPQRCAGDLYLFVLEGDLAVDAGGRQLTAGTEAMVFVPAGTSHRVQLCGTAGARLLALVMPSPPAGAPLFEPVSAVAHGAAGDTAPASGEGAAAFVVALSASGFEAGHRPNGFAVQTLADAARGVRTATMNAARVDAGGEGPAVHIHTFDQLFFVVRGRLHVQVALERVVAETHQLVVLPAGVPHTQWNEGPDTEIHLAVLTPAPAAGEPLTRPVTFGPPAG